jgi:hypothetical protein
MSVKSIKIIASILGFVACVLSGTAVAVILHSNSVSRYVTVSPTPVKTFSEPLRASVVARNLHCKKFRDTGPGTAGLVIDSGVCYLNGRKYGLDTFRTPQVRDRWLKIAASYGVSPKWEGSNAVIYPSVDPNS